MIGDSDSGKTCLIGRYIESHFIDSFVSTIGVDFKIRRLTVDDEVVELQIFDTAGQEKFRSIVSSYYRSSNGIVVAFDLTKKETFDNISYWMSQIDQYSDSKTMRFLVGTKSDLIDKRVVTKEECQGIANEYGCKYYETSALKDENINEMFLDIARETKQRTEKYDNNKSVDDKAINSKPNCC